MIKVTNGQVAVFLAASDKLSDVALDDARGRIAAEAHAEATIKQIAYQYRMKALNKERQKLLQDHAKKDAKGNIQYGEAPDGKAENRPVLFRNKTAADKAFAAWAEKFEAVGDQVVELAIAPIADDFFSKPNELEDIKHGVRIGFLPLMVKAQNALKAAAKPKKR